MIDDDENVRRSTTMMLRARGLLVDVYHSGAELLSSRGDHNSECLLIDYKMPTLDGLQIMQRLRENGDQTPGLMVTGYYSETLQARALKVGYAALLEKPILPSRLIEEIGAVIRL
ncbi:MAG: response regulator [Henriciella sp.]